MSTENAPKDLSLVSNWNCKLSETNFSLEELYQVFKIRYEQELQTLLADTVEIPPEN